MKHLALVFALLLLPVAAWANGQWTPKTSSGTTKGVQTVAGDTSLFAHAIVGTLGVTGNAVFNGNDVILDVDGDSKLDGSVDDVIQAYLSGTSYVYLRANGISTAHNFDAHATLVLNEKGYQNGTTQFRSLIVRDGKTAVILSITGSTKTSAFYGDVVPGTADTHDLGAVGAEWDSLFIHTAAVVGDMPFLDDRNDLALLDSIKGSGAFDEVTGYEFVDDWSLPKEMMILHRKAWTDTVVTERREVDSIAGADTAWAATSDTVLVPYAKGDLMLSAGGKPLINVTHAIGLNQGAIRQLHAEVDELKGQVENLMVLLIAVGAAAGVPLVRAGTRLVRQDTEGA